jgi:acyl-CoA hydrolase
MKLNKEVSFSFFSSKSKIKKSIKKGIPKTLLPFQSGVGNVANAVLACIGK